MPRKGSNPPMEPINATLEPPVIPGTEIALAMELPQALYDEYVDAGFRANEAPGYERDLAEMREAMTASTIGFVRVGEIWTRIKARTQHGSLGFLMNRAGIHERTAQRAIAAYEAFSKYPSLAERASNIAPTTLALIGSRKDMSDAAANEIAALADAGEADAENVTDIIRKHAPQKDKKPSKVKMYFSGLTADRAVEYRNAAQPFLAQAAGSMATAGANLGGLRKSPQFKEWLRELLDNKRDLSAMSEYDRALVGFLAANYMWAHPDR